MWLVNTGWSGGPYGVGSRMKLSYTRAMVTGHPGRDAGRKCPRRADPVFGVGVPESCPDVPSEILQPRNTWDDKEAYDAQAKKLARMFVENFRQFEGETSNEVREAGPATG